MTNSIAGFVLEEQQNEAIQIFSSLKKAGLVSGEFEAPDWGYKSASLRFFEVRPDQPKRFAASPLSKIATAIAKCYMVKNLILQMSPELAVSRLNSFRWLARTIGDRDDLWQEMPISVLNETVAELRKYTKVTTTYHRATALSHFVGFLSNMQVELNGTTHRYSHRLIKWKHGIPNPTRASLELTSPEHEVKRAELYDETLHKAIAQAAFSVKSSPELEISPGFDRIRLEALAFALALGLRIGEICSLPKRAFHYDDDTGLSSLIVAIEKGAPGGAIAIAKIWEEIVRDAAAYLLDMCSAARNLAKEIEDNGFKFITDKLRSYRDKNPLSHTKIQQLRSVGLAIDNAFYIDEMAECFSISSKELGSGGKYGHCLVPLPKESAARLVAWFDLRFSRWDWSPFTTHYKTGGYRIRVEDLVKSIPTSKSSLTKAYWFIDDLRELLSDMHKASVFDPDIKIELNSIDLWRSRWAKLRELALSNRGGKTTAVDVSRFVNTLKTDYTGYLSAHFKEEFSSEGNSSGGGYSGNKMRPGMESKLSEHLIVVWQNQFDSRGVRGIIPRPMLRADIYNFLSNKGGKKTVFERLGIRDDKGEYYSVSPHQIRRWLTTALLRSGPNEAAIDLWMGRKPHQTRHYDYRTAKERAEYVRAQYTNNDNPPNDVLGRKIKIWRQENMGEKEIELLVIDKLKALHFTPWGTCSRELYISPCTKGLMCLRGFGTGSACDSFHVDPTDLQAKQAIQTLKDKYSMMLSAVTNNMPGLVEDIKAELDTSEALDQHVVFMLDVVSGCDEALQAYVQANDQEQ
ncbi:integrase [Pseudomonas sp. JUb42]|uniref:hypothetical protein n=1 Tax=Pseudomonas sp. JUb42 TaxID=2940611 RepID=UPI002168E12E|nr:hypothetical protein [Pseudomonas sp. JUb42]MCS3467916.1 integrase [Pseudomonas sp. JUb42]